jgi:hypothetical protein
MDTPHSDSALPGIVVHVHGLLGGKGSAVCAHRRSWFVYVQVVAASQRASCGGDGAMRAGVILSVLLMLLVLSVLSVVLLASLAGCSRTGAYIRANSVREIMSYKFMMRKSLILVLSMMLSHTEIKSCFTT